MFSEDETLKDMKGVALLMVQAVTEVEESLEEQVKQLKLFSYTSPKYEEFPLY